MQIVTILLGQIDSTQTYAKTHAEDFAPDQLTCIVAEEQTAGRGRYHRKWISPRGVNLYMTFYFLLPKTTPHFTALSQVMATSLVEVLLCEGFHPKIKWPNDVQLHGKKVAGILCEAIFNKETIALLLGIGINVNMAAKDLAAIDQPATSLKEETGHPWDKMVLLHALQKQFAADLDRFQIEGFAPFHATCEKHLAFKGQTVHCFDGQREWVGICHSLTNSGQLNLLLPDRTFHVLSSGDITQALIDPQKD